MKRFATAAVSLLALAGTAANAATIDFEQFGTDNGDLAAILADSFDAFGISFTSSDGIRVIEVGGDPQSGFVPNDTPNPADAFGEFFLGTAFDDNNTDLTITYTTPVDGLSFDLGDIDDDEVFTIQVFDVANNLLQEDTIASGDPGTGNQSVFNYAVGGFGTQIAKVVISGTRNDRLLGIAFDNFQTNINNFGGEVPVPAAAPLFAAGLAGFAALRRRRQGKRA